MKIRRVGAELFQADGQTDRHTNRQTDMTKLIVAFRNFVSAPTNGIAGEW
jgi:Fe-S-cluster formation regulator IscX/YfhJ